MQKAYMVNERIFFDVEKMKNYMLRIIDEWKENGCQGTLDFPKVKIGMHQVKKNKGVWVPVFIEDKTGETYQLI